MPNDVSKLKRAAELGTTMVVGVSMATPACAATWMQSETWMQLQDWPTYVLSGSIALLVIGIALKAIEALQPANREPGPAEPGPDHSIGTLRNSFLRQFLWGDR